MAGLGLASHVEVLPSHQENSVQMWMETFLWINSSNMSVSFLHMDTVKTVSYSGKT